MSSPEHIAFRHAVDIVGNPSKAAKVMGVSRQAVHQVLNSGGPCPPTRVLKLSAASGVTCHQLRPDLYPIEVEAPPARRPRPPEETPAVLEAAGQMRLPVNEGKPSNG